MFLQCPRDCVAGKDQPVNKSEEAVFSEAAVAIVEPTENVSPVEKTP